MRKKTFLVLFIILYSLFLVAFDTKIVELLNPDIPIIDLDTAISLAPIGTQGKDSDNSQEIGKDKGDNIGPNISDQEMVYRIDIEGEKITFRGNDYSRGSLEQLTKDIQSTVSNVNYKVHINLHDKFAEAHIYKEVDSLLNQLKMTYGFTYSAD